MQYIVNKMNQLSKTLKQVMEDSNKKTEWLNKQSFGETCKTLISLDAKLACYDKNIKQQQQRIEDLIKENDLWRDQIMRESPTGPSFFDFEDWIANKHFRAEKDEDIDSFVRRMQQKLSVENPGDSVKNYAFVRMHAFGLFAKKETANKTFKAPRYIASAI